MKETKYTDALIFKSEIEAETIKTLIKAAAILVDDCRITITPKGLSVSAMNEAHTALINLHVAEEAFIEYEAKNLKMGVNLHSLNSIVNLANATDIINLEYDKPQKQLIIKLEDLKKRISILDPVNITKSDIPYINLPAKIKVNSGKLQKGFQASKAVADSVLLSITPDSFEIYANGNIEEVILSLKKDDLIEHDSTTIHKNQYSVDYLYDLINIFGAADTVKIMMGNNQPLQMEYVFAEGNGYLTYIQAPRMDDDTMDTSVELPDPTDEDS